jgi:hypothetical protein
MAFHFCLIVGARLMEGAEQASFVISGQPPEGCHGRSVARLVD